MQHSGAATFYTCVCTTIHHTKSPLEYAHMNTYIYHRFSCEYVYMNIHRMNFHEYAYCEFTWMYAYMNSHKIMHTCIFMYMFICRYSCTCSYVDIHKMNFHGYVYCEFVTWICTYEHVQPFENMYEMNIHAWIRILYMNVRIYTCTSIHEYV